MKDWSKGLEEDLNWREEELASLKLLVVDATAGTVRQRVLLRSLWTMLYAHYEGFCKYAWDYYLDSLQDLAIVREHCCAPIAKFSLSKKFKDLRGDLSADSLWSACTNEFHSWMKDQLRFDVRLETRSNLWPNIIKENASLINLPSATVDLYEVRLRSLVSQRNEIAHGKPLVITTLSKYQPYEDAAVLVMHELAIAIITALEEKQYLKFP